MKITLNYFGQLRHHAGCESESRSIADGCSLSDALREVAADHGPEFSVILLDDSGELRPSVMLLVNDTPVDKAALPALSNGDAVSVLPAIAGG